MLNIKISMPSLKTSDPSIYNFVNSNDNIYNNKKYWINEDINEADYWFVIENPNNLISEKTSVKNNNIFFLSSETSFENMYYSRPSKLEFLSQFKEIYSSDFIFRKNVVNTPPFLPWKIFSPMRKNIDGEISDIEKLRNLSIKKTKLLSVICSDKTSTPFQQVRLEFINNLKKELGGDLDWFGRGFNFISKEDGILPYKYHIVLENQNRHNVISEKLYDCYLGMAYPIYSGANNLNEYFPEKSFLNLDLNNFRKSLDSINDLLASNTYEENVALLQNARNVVLDDFNFIKRIDNIVNENEEVEIENKYKEITIMHRRSYENKSRLAKLLFKINKVLRKIISKLESYYT